jgi:hypothetical protein
MWLKSIIKALMGNRLVGLLLLAMAVSAGSPSAAQQDRWLRYGDREIGVSVDLPLNLFTVDRGPSEKLNGRTFATPDGRADVSLYSIPNPAGDTPRAFLEKRFELPSSSVVYRRVTNRIVAVSGFRRDKIWYARCNFNAGLVNCVALNYPTSEKRQWDAIVTRISNSLSSPDARSPS